VSKPAAWAVAPLIEDSFVIPEGAVVIVVSILRCPPNPATQALPSPSYIVIVPYVSVVPDPPVRRKPPIGLPAACPL